MDRYAVILGAMECGTTELYKALSQHPEIAPSRDEQPDYLNRPGITRADRDEYNARWAFDPATHAVRLDGSTCYAKTPAFRSGAFAAHDLGGDFRFIYLVREPVERIRSDYLHSVAEGWVRRPIQDGVDLQQLFTTNYRMQLMPYERLFGRDRILVLHHAELCADIVGTARRVSAFIGVRPDHPFHDPGIHNWDPIYLGQILRKFGAEVGLDDIRWERYLHRCSSLAEIAGAVAADHPRDATTLVELVQRVDRWTTPTPEQEDEIRAWLRPDLDLFAQEWGIDPREDATASPGALDRAASPVAVGASLC